MDRLEDPAVIKFCRDPGETPTEGYKMITIRQTMTSISRTLVFQWYKMFRPEWSVSQERSGRWRKSSVTEKTLTSFVTPLIKRDD